jgi:hypothetical protein
MRLFADLDMHWDIDKASQLLLRAQAIKPSSAA